MPNHEITIEEMVLRVPGKKEYEANVIVQEALKEVADKMPSDDGYRKIDNLELSVRIASDATPTTIAHNIALAIIKSFV